MEELVLIEAAGLEHLPLSVRMPRDSRLLKLCGALLEQPGDTSTADELADRIGASTRTLRRLFQEEVGMSFAAWRQQVRLMEALARLAEGQAIARVSRELGYAAPSAFVAMFRRAMGCSPSRFAKGLPVRGAPGRRVAPEASRGRT